VSKWTDERWVAAGDDAALEVEQGERPPVRDDDSPAWVAERAAYEAMAELADPVADPTDVELAAALVAAAASPIEADAVDPTEAQTNRVLFASVALFAVAAALLLWWGLSGTTLFEQRETGPRELTPDVLDPEPSRGEAEVRERHAQRSRKAAVAAPAQPDIESDPVETPTPPQTTEPQAPTPKRSQSPPPSPDVLLARARRLRAAHDLAGAERAYRSLMSAHPKSPEAHAARVAAGQVQLKRGRSRAALASFRRYLERGGPLGQEARWGEIQALHALGKAGQRDAAIDALQRRHPKSVFLPMARELQ